MGLDYKASGVDVEEGYRAVELMKSHVAKTFNANVLAGLGSFGALYELGGGYENPVLVSGTDGVGTKLKLAFMTGIHDSIGIDLVAMCANDVLCHGAKPLFFLDYFATGRLRAEVVAEVVSGIAAGCLQAGAALVGGETAEMPGFYEDGTYDLAGFCVGVADRSKLITGATIQAGDVVIGLASSGCHSNGYSLVRKVFFDTHGLKADAVLPGATETLGEMLLRPTRIYVKAVHHLLERVTVHGMAHVTGGGFYENLPRMMPEGLAVCIKKGSWPTLPVFTYLQEMGQVDTQAMFNTFNMGIGMALVVRKADASSALAALAEAGEQAYVIGEIKPGAGVIFEE